MDKNYTVRFSIEARSDLEAATNWMKQDSIEAAEAFFTVVQSKCQINLASTPHMGVKLRLVDGTTLFAMTSGTYRIFYIVDDQARDVTIVRLLHTSRDIIGLLDLAA